MHDLEHIRQALRSVAYDEALAGHLGLNATDLRCLELALAEPGLTPSRLAERSGLTTGAVTGVLDRLEHGGYVARRPDPSDRRSVAVFPSPSAGEQVRNACEPLDASLQELLRHQAPDGQTAIRAFLDAAAGAVAAETARLRAGSRGGFLGNVYRAPLGEATRGRLVFVSGAPRLALNISPLGPQAAARVIMETSASRLRFSGAAEAGQLIRATFSGPLPEVRVSSGVVTVRYRRGAMAAFSSRKAQIALASGIPWAIELQGGLTDLEGSLTGLSVTRLDVDDGANHVDLDLPGPTGSVPLRIGGVANAVKLRRPAGVAVGLRVLGGISHLRLDGASHEQVAGDRRFTSRDYADAADRYEVEVLAGANRVRIESG